MQELQSYWDRQKGDFTNVNILIKEAKRANLWIYSDGKWFSPEEFEQRCTAKDGLTNREIEVILQRAKIRDPRAGITAAHKQLDEILAKFQKDTELLRNKLSEFNKKVIDYYQNKSTGKYV